MWLMSNRPTRWRTAWCSSTIVEYWTGIDQPPNSTSRPPWAWCQSCSGVFKQGFAGHRPSFGVASIGRSGINTRGPSRPSGDWSRL